MFRRQPKFPLSPLLGAIQQGSVVEVQRILDHNPEQITKRGPNADYPLHEACKLGHEDIVKALIARGAAINAQNKQGYTALHFATERGYANIVSLLLDNQAAVDIVNTNRQTALHKVTRVSVALILLQHGASINAMNIAGETVLHECCMRGNEELIPLLLEYGSDLNRENIDSFTPLFTAVAYGNEKTAQVLLNAGANVTNHKGLTPMKFSRTSSLKTILTKVRR
jgi:ankyrin repeat protein